MGNVDYKAIFEFLKEWKTRTDLCLKFELSNNESYHVLRWLKKGKFIEEQQMRMEGYTNHRRFYRIKEEVVLNES